MTKEIVVQNLELDIAGVLVDGPSLDIGVLTEDQFEQLGWKLKAVNGFTQFWIGDWANALHDQHGKGAMTRIAGLVGYEAGSVWKWAEISRKYDSRTRVRVMEKYPQLTHRHFQEAAHVSNPKAVLEAAGKQGWTTREVTTYVKENYPSQREQLPEEDGGEGGMFSWHHDTAIDRAFDAISTVENAVGRLTAVDRQDPTVADGILKRLKNGLEPVWAALEDAIG